jgi:hypothetical protein
MDPRKINAAEIGFRGAKALRMMSEQRQVELIKQNDEIIRLLGEVVRLLSPPGGE